MTSQLLLIDDRQGRWISCKSIYIETDEHGIDYYDCELMLIAPVKSIGFTLTITRNELKHV